MQNIDAIFGKFIAALAVPWCGVFTVERQWHFPTAWRYVSIGAHVVNLMNKTVMLNVLNATPLMKGTYKDIEEG